MLAELRQNIEINGKTLPKGEKGRIIGVSNSEAILKHFPELKFKEKEYFYLVSFENVGNIPVSKNQIEII